MDEVERVRSAPDPLDRVRMATDAVSALQAAIVELGGLRREAVDELRSRGLSLTSIAEQAGVSRARLSQLGSTRPRPERSMLSTGGLVTIAVPVEEAAYPEGQSRPVVHREDAAFLEQMIDLAGSLGLRAEVEYVGSGQFIDLNRDGLVVTCGPRQSPWLEQALSADEHYGFGRDEEGWYLEDRSGAVRHHSPADQGRASDYGYLGVLNRPDGRGGWLYTAGIHAAGSRGAARYLSDNLGSLYRVVKDTAWSCLVRCDYDPATRRLVGTELLAPVRRRGRLRTRH